MTVLADYISEDDLAAELGLTVRTLQTLETPGGSGLRSPSCRVLYRREAVLDWLRWRERSMVRERKRAA